MRVTIYTLNELADRATEYHEALGDPPEWFSDPSLDEEKRANDDDF